MCYSKRNVYDGDDVAREGNRDEINYVREINARYFNSAYIRCLICIFFFQAEDGIRDRNVTGVQTCALPIWRGARADGWRALRNAAAFAHGDASATAGLLISRRLLRRGATAAANRMLDWLESSVRDDLRVSVARARLLEWGSRVPHGPLRVVADAQA